MSTLLEGMEASVQPCTLAVVLPALAVIIGGGIRAVAGWVGFVAGCTWVFWARAAGHWTLDRQGGLRLLVAALALGAFVLLVRRNLRGHDVTFSAAVVVGALAGWLWRPCVGARLGDLLNAAPGGGVGPLPSLALYVSGVVLLPLGLALLPHAVPRLRATADRPGVRMSAVVFAVLYAGLIATSRYDDLVAELLQRSSA